MYSFVIILRGVGFQESFMSYLFYTGIGQDSHRFLQEKGEKKCVIGGLTFDTVPGFDADSDGDVVLHAFCNAISSLTHVPILGEVASLLCQQGQTASTAYLEAALSTLGQSSIIHVAFTIEGARPRLQSSIERMRFHLASLAKIGVDQVGITCTSGDGLTAFGRGEGVMCFCLLTISKKA